eukprot:8906-Heterococcus_DN1.PRE.1
MHFPIAASILLAAFVQYQCCMRNLLHSRRVCYTCKAASNVTTVCCCCYYYSTDRWLHQVQSFEKFHKVWAFIPLTAEQLRQAIGAVEVVAGLGSLKKATRTLSYLVLTAIYAGKF